MSEKPLTSDQFVVLIARYERRVRSFIATIASCRGDVLDETLQATYLTAWQKLSSFTYLEATPDEELVRWMCTIARFEYMSVIRRFGTSHVPFDAKLIERIAEVCIQQSEALESRHVALKACIEKLPSRQREMLRLRYWRGMSIAELASQRRQEHGAVYTVNEDRSVDGEDLSAWRAGFGQFTSGATHGDGDANGDGAVDAADFLQWQSHVGQLTAPSAAAAVPEPTSLWVAIAHLCLAPTLARAAAMCRLNRSLNKPELR